MYEFGSPNFAKQSADLGRFGNGSRMKFIANHLVAMYTKLRTPKR